MIAHVLTTVLIASVATQVRGEEDGEVDHSTHDHGDADEHSADEHSADASGDAHDAHSAAAPVEATGEVNTLAISGAEGAVGAEDSLCYFTYDKCVISKPYVAVASGLPLGWARCTEKNLVTDVHATGWDCESDGIDDKTDMGCANQNVLHALPEMAHLMDACMPGTVTEANAQAYWDTYDAYQVCIRDETTTAMECADLVVASFMNEMDLALPDVSVEGFEAALTENIQLCAAATTEMACTMVEGTFEEMVTPVTGVTLAITDGTATAETETDGDATAADTTDADAVAADTTATEDDEATVDSGVCAASAAAALVGTAVAALLL